MKNGIIVGKKFIILKQIKHILGTQLGILGDEKLINFLKE